MKNNLLKLSGLALGSLFMFACASNIGNSGFDNTLKVSADDNYVYIIDYEKMERYEQAYKNSLQSIDNIWINPPTKKITREEYDELVKQVNN